MVFELDSDKLERLTSLPGNSRQYLHDFEPEKLQVVIKVDEHYGMEVPTLLALKDSPHVLPVVDTGFVDRDPAYMRYCNFRISYIQNYQILGFDLNLAQIRNPELEWVHGNILKF
ncbi:hypothetical protein J8273_7617 [Carpediemonas membranifera]|uniref:Uncharacterized protein n=1 Tax=Carpediemonas membranifera TaxID=201153 RepID=A0A8J6E060_9EUKA|nr:hypothetical protein J8273_7617 [Carpediemonas membranifera]|eukprot:KAG9391331.1 hypothetical protein J8273_7617 [Carpediemonas membranifera]